MDFTFLLLVTEIAVTVMEKYLKTLIMDIFWSFVVYV